jgi:hypothetical protein
VRRELARHALASTHRCNCRGTGSCRQLSSSSMYISALRPPMEAGTAPENALNFRFTLLRATMRATRAVIVSQVYFVFVPSCICKPLWWCLGPLELIVGRLACARKDERNGLQTCRHERLCKEHPCLGDSATKLAGMPHPHVSHLLHRSCTDQAAAALAAGRYAPAAAAVHQLSQHRLLK